MDCDKYIELMSAALDGECTAEERRQLDSHLAVCPECAELFNLLSANANAIRELDCDMPADLKDRIMSSLPEQEKPARKGKVIHWKRWVPVVAAACLVLVVSLIPRIGIGGNTSGDAAPNAFAPSASTAAEAYVSDADLERDAYGGITVESAESTSDASYGEATTPDAATSSDPAANSYEFGVVPANCLFSNPQTIRVRDFFFYTDQAFIISSPYELDGFLTQLTPTWGEDLQPAFAALPETYDQEFFLTKRLLVVLVFGSSGSNRYQLDPYGLYHDSVTVLMTEKGGTLDVAQWCFIAEVDDTFSSGDRLDVVIEPDYN